MFCQPSQLALPCRTSTLTLISLVCCFAYEFSVIKGAKLRRIRKSNYKWSTLLVAFEEESFTSNDSNHVNKQIWCGLDSSWLKNLSLLWPRQDRAKCVNAKTFKKSRDQDQSRVITLIIIFQPIVKTEGNLSHSTQLISAPWHIQAPRMIEKSFHTMNNLAVMGLVWLIPSSYIHHQSLLDNFQAVYWLAESSLCVCACVVFILQGE